MEVGRIAGSGGKGGGGAGGRITDLGGCYRGRERGRERELYDLKPTAVLDKHHFSFGATLSIDKDPDEWKRVVIACSTLHRHTRMAAYPKSPE